MRGIVKLNLGCGIKREDDYFNIDLDQASAPDIIANVGNLGFLGDNSVEEIKAYHLIEHLTEREFLDALVEWFRILKIGGTIIIECPDFTELCKLWIEADKVNRWHSYQGTWHGLIRHFYGNQRTPLQIHKNGFSRERLLDLLTMHGFVDAQFTDPEYQYCPCIRVEAVKG